MIGASSREISKVAHVVSGMSCRAAARANKGSNPMDMRPLCPYAAVQIAHPLSGQVRLVASPIKLSATPVQYRRPPPLLGEHTDEVLREFGMGESELAALRAARAI